MCIQQQHELDEAAGWRRKEEAARRKQGREEGRVAGAAAEELRRREGAGGGRREEGPSFSLNNSAGMLPQRVGKMPRPAERGCHAAHIYVLPGE